jgi:23S rRNA pseudouridine2605 synthase
MSSRSTSRKPEGRGERVQKVLASVGIASRREIDRLVQSGRVVIDGRPAVPGDRLTGQEKVFIDGNRIRLAKPRTSKAEVPEILLYHKPAGEIAARRDPKGRKSVFESLPRSRQGRWIEVGRLDINTSGLLLFTTDGELANKLVQSGHHLEQYYAVRVRGSLSTGQIKALTRAAHTGDGQAGIESVTAMGGGRTNNWYEIKLKDGGKRDLRGIFDEFEVPVSRLIRIRYGPVDLGRLPRGGYRLLDESERDQILLAVKDQQQPSR